jgi:hypothetical protein
MRNLSDYLLQSASNFDVPGSAKSETFYHGFVLALLASLPTTHMVRSNRESGFGRYDLLLIPKSATNSISVLLEFKHAKKAETLEAAATSALNQIQSRAYHTELLQHPHIRKVVEVGIAFSGKAAVAAHAAYDLVAQTRGALGLTTVPGR